MPLTLQGCPLPSPAPEAPSTAALELHGLSVRYGRREALRALTLRVNAGQFVLVTGPSGCGKSTLALAVCGLIPQANPAQMQGSVRVFGRSTRDQPVHALAEQVGIVFQNPSAQFFYGQVEEEVAFGRSACF